MSQRTATITSLPMAFEVVKAMQGEGYRPLGRQALAEIIEDQMAALKRQAWPEEGGALNAWPAVFEDSRQWCFLSLRPGTDPLKALVESFLDTWLFAATDPERVKRQNGWIALLRDGAANAGRSDRGHRAAPPVGYLKSDATMVFHIEPAHTSKQGGPPQPASTGAATYTWAFGKEPERSTGK
jgi:hypothetical protein